jgi:exopolysaccharide production protein ExoQ
MTVGQHAVRSNVALTWRPGRHVSFLHPLRRERWHAVPYYVLLAAVLIQYSGAWYYEQFTGFDTDGMKPLATAFQYPLWASIVLGGGLHLLRNGLVAECRHLALFVPLLFFGVASSVIGIDPLLSFRYLAFWTLMALAATVCVARVPALQLAKIVFYVFFVEMALSVALATLLPSIGINQYLGRDVGWRGVFTSKNALGWICAWAMGVAFLFRPIVGRLRSLILVSMSGICLVGTDSKGGLVASAAAIAFLFVSRYVHAARMTPRLKAVSFVLILLAASTTLSVASEGILDLLERDSTLTGRSDVWSGYLDRISERWILGYGPGVLSGPSALTEELYNQFSSYGVIRTPHSAYLAALGEGGIVGATCFVLPLLYLAFVHQFTRPNLAGRACSLAAFLILTGGLVETHEIYSAGIGGFLLILMHALSQRQGAPVSPYGRGAKRPC